MKPGIRRRYLGSLNDRIVGESNPETFIKETLQIKSGN